MQGKTESPKYYIRLERLPSRRTVFLSWLNWASNWASFFLDGRTELVWRKIQFWSLYIGWRGEITRTCVRRGECNSFLFLIPALFSDTQHLVSGPPSHHRWCSGPGMEGCRCRGMHIFTSTAQFAGGEGFDWRRAFRGKMLSHLPLCITEEEYDLTWQPWSSELPWRFTWRSEAPGGDPSGTLPRADRRGRDAAGAVGASPARPPCEHRLCWLPFRFASKKLNE